jgi:hypothetical protein
MVFTVAEEAIFGKGWENYAGHRTEIWHKNYPYDVAQIVVGISFSNLKLSFYFFFKRHQKVSQCDNSKPFSKNVFISF